MSEDSRFNVSPSGLVLLGVVTGLVVAQIYVINNLRSVEGKVATIEEQQTKAQTTLTAEAAKIKETVAVDAVTRQKALEAVRGELEETKRQAVGVVGQAKQEAVKEALKGVHELENRVTADQQELKDQQTQVATELSNVRQTATTAQTDIAAVSTEVTAVKANIASTQSQLERTISDLKRVNGDMGVMSGLIATNGKEINALRQLGDRNYFEFALSRNNKPTQVGDVWLTLKKADAGRSRYTIEISADDRKVEKKDRTSNEPIQFYVANSRTPYEVVINQVHKDQVVGYLATPKVLAARK